MPVIKIEVDIFTVEDKVRVRFVCYYADGSHVGHIEDWDGQTFVLDFLPHGKEMGPC